MKCNHPIQSPICPFHYNGECLMEHNYECPDLVKQTNNEPELYAGRCNGKTLYDTKRMFDRAICEAIKGKKPDDDFSCIEIRIPDYALIEHADEFVGAIINDMKRHISDRISDILSPEDEYIMSLSSSRANTDPLNCTQTMRILLKHKQLVRCRDCVYCKRAQITGELMCNHPSFVHHIDQTDGYCHHGKKPDLADYLFKEEPDVKE